MKRTMFFGAAVVLLIFLATNCAEQPGPSVPVAPPTVSPQQSGATGSKTVWEAEWDKTLAAAKKEGELLVYMHLSSEAATPMANAFNKKFGIRMETLTAPSPNLRQRLHAEYRAGLYLVDVYMGGAGGVIVQTKPLGYLSPIEPALILPEVKDPKMWLGGKLPSFDEDGTAYAWLAIVSPGIVYNSNLVKKGEIGSYLDLLKPEWKEKIIMTDPSAGTGSSVGGMHILVEEWGLDRTRDYLTRLIKDQKAVVTRDHYQSVEWVARGKVSVVVFPETPTVVQLVKEGLPLAIPATKEPQQISASNGGLALLTRRPHPKATSVFVNWLLSREGQAVASEAFSAPSARVDVSAESVPEMFRPKPGQRYVNQTEERTAKQTEYVPEWRRIVGQ